MSLLDLFRRKVHLYRDLVRNLGARAGILLMVVDATLFVAKRAPIRPRRRLSKVRIRGYEHPVWFRWFSSDAYVIQQIFSEREYAPVRLAPDPEVILDCGANIGCSAVWFLQRYPGARVICVEPDASNVEVCRRNVAPWGDAVEVLQGAVWSSDEPLVMSDEDDLEWGYRVGPGAGGVCSFTMDELIARSPTGQVDLLKMDVEGAEQEIFSRPGAWLDAIRNVFVELHGPAATKAFFEALKPYSYDLSTSGELSVCTSLRPRSTAVT